MEYQWSTERHYSTRGILEHTIHSTAWLETEFCTFRLLLMRGGFKSQAGSQKFDQAIYDLYQNKDNTGSGVSAAVPERVLGKPPAGCLGPPECGAPLSGPLPAQNLKTWQQPPPALPAASSVAGG